MKNKGFTLLEMITVVLIIGIVLTVVSMTPPSNPVGEREAKRLYHLLGLASEEAVIRSRSMAVVFSRHGYEFAFINGDKLQTVDGDKIFRKREFPQELELELEYQGEPAVFDDKDNPPLVYIFSSGEMTQFTLKLKMLDSEPYTIQANFLGQLKLIPPNAEIDV